MVVITITVIAFIIFRFLFLLLLEPRCQIFQLYLVNSLFCLQWFMMPHLYNATSSHFCLILVWSGNPLASLFIFRIVFDVLGPSHFRGNYRILLSSLIIPLIILLWFFYISSVYVSFSRWLPSWWRNSCRSSRSHMHTPSCKKRRRNPPRRQLLQSWLIETVK